MVIGIESRSTVPTDRLESNLFDEWENVVGDWFDTNPESDNEVYDEGLKRCTPATIKAACREILAERKADA